MFYPLSVYFKTILKQILRPHNVVSVYSLNVTFTVVAPVQGGCLMQDTFIGALLKKWNV